MRTKTQLFLYHYTWSFWLFNYSIENLFFPEYHYKWIWLISSKVISFACLQPSASIIYLLVLFSSTLSLSYLICITCIYHPSFLFFLIKSLYFIDKYKIYKIFILKTSILLLYSNCKIPYSAKYLFYLKKLKDGACVE